MKAATGLVSEVPFQMATFSLFLEISWPDWVYPPKGSHFALILSLKTLLPNIDILSYSEVGIQYEFGRRVTHPSPLISLLKERV